MTPRESPADRDHAADGAAVPAEPSPETVPAERSSRAAVLRLAALVIAFAGVSTALHLSGWNGPARLQALVESAGWAGVIVFVVGYAVLVLVPTPASLLTVLGGALFGLWWGTLLAWAGAMLGAYGGLILGRRLGRSSVDRLLRGRLQQADRLLVRHGLVAVLAVRLVPLFPFTPLNYASGLLGVRRRDYVLGTAIGILPGSLAYAAVGASGADPRGIALGAGGLVLLAVLGGTLGRRLLATSSGPGSDRSESGTSGPGAGRPGAGRPGA
ncbi:TVP38/TMEM64 family protein [Isoptericola jiangsuensis]|uniref:TVP38/TMEM64 family protein n=1 Tax=Isoptericola jiangsuensis TaxID=548579 RepID=UPI003AAEEB68